MKETTGHKLQRRFAISLELRLYIIFDSQTFIIDHLCVYNT